MSPLRKVVDALFGVDRAAAEEAGTCIQPPIGCGKPCPPSSFRNEISRREYLISGLCQACQDSVFGGPDHDPRPGEEA